MKIIDKFYIKLNNRLNKLEEDGDVLPSVDSLIEELEKLGLTNLSIDEILLTPFVVKSATNKDLYEKLSMKYTKMSYKKYLEFLRNLDKDEIIEYLITNMKYTSYNNFFEKSWMDSFIKYKINRSICPGIISKMLNPLKELEFKIFCDCLLKKKAHDHDITITSNPMNLSEYLSSLKETGKRYRLVKACEYLHTAGTCNLDSNININTTTLSLAKFLMLDFNFNLELLQVLYHEFIHAKHESMIKKYSPFLNQKLYKMAKTVLILHKASGIYNSNHDHFEIEIAATEEACLELLHDLEGLDIKRKEYYKEKIEEKLAEVRLRRNNELYDLNDELFDKLLMKFPEYIKVIPGLSYEYDRKTGERKEIPDLLVEKMRFKAGLEKKRKSELSLGENTTYYDEFINNEEIDKLFDEMIYKKIMSYSASEYSELVASYPASSQVSSEVRRILESKEAELHDRIDILSVMAKLNINYNSSLYTCIKNYRKVKDYIDVLHKKEDGNKVKRRD